MRYFNTLYLLLLAYIIAALVFWGISLNKQSRIIYEQELLHLRSQVDSANHPAAFTATKSQMEEKRERRKKQYIGEGTTFLLVIFIGAAVVYSSFVRNIRLSRQQNNFMLSVTHELKSPLAAMKLNLQTLERYQLDEEKKHALIENCIHESNRLNELCNNMLLASQMEGGQYKSIKEDLNFTELLRTKLKDYMQRYPDRFEEKVSSASVWIYGDHLMLDMAVSNLIENALKYSPADQKITISFSEKNGLAEFSVADHGTGIPESERKKIFRKFYRIGNENTRRTKGTGLGLYLTRQIVKQQNGNLFVTTNKPHGSIFKMQLPLRQNA